MRTSTPKDRRTLRALSAAILTAATLGTIAFATLPSKAATTAPELSAKLVHRGAQVSLHWTFTTDSKRQRDRRVEIKRSAAGEPDVVFTKNNAGRSGSYTDTTSPADTPTYRARVLILSSGAAPNATAVVSAVVMETTPWSDPVSVEPTSPPTTTVPPTTVPPTTGDKSCPDLAAQKATFMHDLKAARGPSKPIEENTRLDDVAYQRNVFFTQHGFDEHAGAGAAIGATWAEVVAWQWPGESGAWNFWKNSQHHWPYMTSASYSKVGYSCVMGNGGPWYTADFQG